MQTKCGEIARINRFEINSNRFLLNQHTLLCHRSIVDAPRFQRHMSSIKTGCQPAWSNLFRNCWCINWAMQLIDSMLRRNV